MGQTIAVFPRIKKLYRKISKNTSVDNVVHGILNIGTNAFAYLLGFKFPKKFNWDWKLEMLLHLYEKETVALFRKIIKPGMTVIDIGAHVGYFTRMYASLVGTSGAVYAYEAAPENFALLRRNTKRLPNVKIFEMAVADHIGTIDFYETENNTGCHSLVASDLRQNKLTVASTSLDALLENGALKKIDVIKMDIEGGEPIALEGMKNVLAANPECRLIVEFCPENLRDGAITPVEFINRLHALGLRTFAITEDGLKEITPEDSALGRYFISKNYVNLYCSRIPLHETT
jgi:FkbM family methyltransferase